MVKKTKKEIEKLKKKARGYSIRAGIFNSAKQSFGSYYISPFAVAINSSNALVAMLSSISGLINPLSEILGSRLIEKYSRKKILLKMVLLEIFTWIPFILIAFLFYKNILTPALPFLLLLSFSLYSIFFGLGYPAWFSWMGDIVDEKKRGRWFSKRNLLIGAVSVILVVSSSFLLDFFKKNDMTMLGFGLLFSLALISRIFSLRALKKQYEPKIKLKKADYFSFWDFLLNARKNNFGRFALFRFFFTFAVSISSPLIVVYILRYLNFSYSSYMIVIFTGTGISLFIMELWGKFSDKYGTYRTLIISSLLLTLIPFLWILHPSMIYLMLIPSALSGIAWAGVHLTEVNFIYENVHPQKRGLAVSYYNMLWGLGTFFGAGLGALLIKFLNTTFIQPIILIFIIGGIARIIILIWWLPKIKEIRKTRKFKSRKALGEIVFKQAIPTIRGEIHDLIHIKKYLRKK